MSIYLTQHHYAIIRLRECQLDPPRRGVMTRIKGLSPYISVIPHWYLTALAFWRVG
jgi:hypothetical protein